jgi:hypothetical protein
MAECIHGFEEEQCAICASSGREGHSMTGTMAGKTFALVYAPTLRNDTFLHLNREGDHWKFRWYRSPHQRPVELAQSGKASTRTQLELKDVAFVHEVAYPYTTDAGGVTVNDSAYWFDEIARANDEHDIRQLADPERPPRP